MNTNKLFASLALAVFATTSSSVAFDADTLAFYAFKDGTAGSAVGETTNSVGLESFVGTAQKGKGNDSLTYDADAPGKYVFAGLDAAEPLASDVQSVSFSPYKQTTEGYGARIRCDWLGTALSSNGDYTVEFFWK